MADREASLEAFPDTLLTQPHDPGVEPARRVDAGVPEHRLEVTEVRAALDGVDRARVAGVVERDVFGPVESAREVEQALVVVGPEGVGLEEQADRGAHLLVQMDGVGRAALGAADDPKLFAEVEVFNNRPLQLGRSLERGRQHQVAGIVLPLEAVARGAARAGREGVGDPLDDRHMDADRRGGAWRRALHVVARRLGLGAVERAVQVFQHTPAFLERLQGSGCLQAMTFALPAAAGPGPFLRAPLRDGGAHVGGGDARALPRSELVDPGAQMGPVRLEPGPAADLFQVADGIVRECAAFGRWDFIVEIGAQLIAVLSERLEIRICRKPVLALEPAHLDDDAATGGICVDAAIEFEAIAFAWHRVYLKL